MPVIPLTVWVVVCMCSVGSAANRAPIELVKPDTTQLQALGIVALYPGFQTTTAQDVTSDTPPPRLLGIRLSIKAGSVLHKAGLEEGDIVESIDGTPINLREIREIHYATQVLRGGFGAGNEYDAVLFPQLFELMPRKGKTKWILFRPRWIQSPLNRAGFTSYEKVELEIVIP